MSRSNPAHATAAEPRPPLVRALRSAERLLIGMGVTLLVIYGISRIDARVGEALAIEEVELALAQTATLPATTPPRDPMSGASTAIDGVTSDASADASYFHAERAAGLSTDDPDQSLWSAKRIAAYQDSLTRESGRALGILSIDRLDVRVPVFEGTSELVLNRGLGRIEGTAGFDERGNVGIAGHRDGFFRPLKDLELGDAIDVRWPGGRLRYRVNDLLIVDPSDVSVLNRTRAATLTLVTCYPFYFVGHAPQRFIVKAAAETMPATGLD